MEWNWRVVAYAGVFCAILSCCGMIGGIAGERGYLYLAFSYFVGLLCTTIAVTIDWLQRRDK